jgi:hypothetical protein
VFWPSLQAGVTLLHVYNLQVPHDELTASVCAACLQDATFLGGEFPEGGHTLPIPLEVVLMWQDSIVSSTCGSPSASSVTCNPWLVVDAMLSAVDPFTLTILQNLEIVEKVKAVAARHDCTPGQVALAWLHAQVMHACGPVPQLLLHRAC